MSPSSEILPQHFGHGYMRSGRARSFSFLFSAHEGLTNYQGRRVGTEVDVEGKRGGEAGEGEDPVVNHLGYFAVEAPRRWRFGLFGEEGRKKVKRPVSVVFYLVLRF